jgi:Do/DeqQ family serine protease
MRWIACLSALIIIGSSVAFARIVPESQTQIQLSFAPVVKQAAPAVVNIYAKTLVERRRSPFAGDPFFDKFFGGFGDRALSRKRIERSLGSGVIVSQDGLVVTNYHVVANAVEVTAALADKREFSAAIILADKASDLAVLRLDGASNLPTLSFGDSDALQVGDLVLAIGNPFGVGQTVTVGIISAQARTGAEGRTFIQTDAAINPGNSGGALVDMAGNLAGVNSAILTRSGGSNGIGFAIPAALARQAVKQAQQGEKRLRRPWLGVRSQPIGAEIARSLGFTRPQGVILTHIDSLSPFAEAGLVPGSIILSFAGHPVADPAELAFRAAAFGVGETVEIRANVGGRAIQTDILLIAAPESPSRDETVLRGRFELAGLRVANLNPAVAEEIRTETGSDDLPDQGVVVLELSDPVVRFDLRRGDILQRYNGVEILSVDDLRRAVRRDSYVRELRVQRGARSLILRYRF